ncbi:Putative Protein similar to C30D11.08c of Schizosaccharomyces pombe [Podospora comata]|uniref:PHD-type domain-containing protein n=1 Tax=Podospora comata TaxID=48703 RepID=A0ABY6SIA1_PODCO|nr:Putative Protein similar to C30D11.08c of Schizosaccharomyces pombe [Podospora comata]
MSSSEKPKEGTVDAPKDAPKTTPSLAIGLTPRAPSTGPSAAYIPQFSAATQMILKRLKGEPSNLGAALSQASRSPSITASIPSATYEDVKRRLVMSMNTSSQMSMQMPATAPLSMRAPSVPLPAPSLAIPPSNKSTSGMSAIRKVTAGLTGSSKNTPNKFSTAPKVLSSDSKVKKAKGKPNSRATGHSNKHRQRLKGQSADNSGISDSDSEVETPTTASTGNGPFSGGGGGDSTPTATMTKSGRQVLKPDAYNPAAMEAATKKRVHYGKRTAEQALCKKCSRMHSPSSNQIVFCDGCDAGWHQYCHDPFVSDDIIKNTSKNWFCSECAAKKERQGSHAKKLKQEHVPRGPPKKESWAGKSVQQKKAYLSTLPAQELVGLLMTSLELHPDLPIFPSPVVDTGVDASGAPRGLFAGGTTEGLFTRANANPTGQGINFMRKVQSNGSARGSQDRTAGQQEEEDEEDPLTLLWPKPGKGLYARLGADVLDEGGLLDAEGEDFEAFSSIVYDDRGRKVLENGMKV